jgi:hypothetical protein
MINQQYTPDPVNSQTFSFADELGNKYTQVIPACSLITQALLDQQIADLQSNIDGRNNEDSGFDATIADIAQRKAQNQKDNTDDQTVMDKLKAQKLANFNKQPTGTVTD